MRGAWQLGFAVALSAPLAVGMCAAWLHLRGLERLSRSYRCWW